GLVDDRRMQWEARALVEGLELDVDPRTPVARLRLAAQQVVEIAKAISFDARVLIMDEPTSALSPEGVAPLYRLIDRCKTRGMAIIYITHRLEELPRIADDLAVLRDGKLIAAKSYAETTHAEIIRSMVGRELAAAPTRSAEPTGGEAIAVCDLS